MKVYLDYNATTPVDARVSQTMVPWLGERFGNAASGEHVFGWDAADAVDAARSAVSELVHAIPRELVFTSGATESICTALHGFAAAHRGSAVIVTAAAEHRAVLDAAAVLGRRQQAEIRIAPVTSTGRPDLSELDALIPRNRPTLLALTAANNEIGTCLDPALFARFAHHRDAYYFCDLTQAVGRSRIDVGRMDIDYAAFSAHKIYGPMGIGALYARHASPALEPLIPGGHELGRRGGSVPVPPAVGFGAACAICARELDMEVDRVRRLRDSLERGITSLLDGVWLNGDPMERLCNTTNLGFAGVDARLLIRDMHDVAVSTKSACSSQDPAPSHVLEAIGLSDERARSCIRFSLGRFTTDAEIDYAVERLVHSVTKLRRAERHPA